jgi:hypothetical protein
VARRCDYTGYKKRVNSCVMNNRELSNQKYRQKNPGNALSDALLMSRFQNFAADAVSINKLIRITSGPNILRSCHHHWQQGGRQTTTCTRLTQDSRKVRTSFHDKEVSAPLNRRACTGACAFSAESMHAFRQVS